MSRSISDEYGELSEQIKLLTKRKDMLKTKLQKLGTGEHVGERYVVSVTHKVWQGFDLATFQEDHFDTYLEYQRTKDYSEVTVQKKG